MKKFISMWFWVGVSFLMTQNVFAITSTKVFSKHLNPIFIETGTYKGEGVTKALQAGYIEVYSIELDPTLYQQCKAKFQHNPNVHLYLGNSRLILEQILPHIQQNATFWLDAHYSAGNTAMGDTNTPILDELEVIAKHPIHTHTIMIDDVRLFGTAEFDFISLEDIIEALLKINPEYTIFFEDGYIANDVLVAKIL